MSAAQLRVLYVLAPARHGGLESVVASLSAGFATRGHAVHVAPVIEPRDVDGHPFLAALATTGATAHPFGLSARAYRKERAMIRELAADVGADVIHTHGYRADVLHVGVGRPRQAAVTTVHGFTGGDWKNRLYERLQILAFRRFDAVVAVSDLLARQLARRGVPADRLTTIVNAYMPPAGLPDRHEARRRLGITTASPRIGFVGRLSREKGADVLVQALAQLRDDTTLSIIGEGPERGALLELSRAIGVESRIVFHGGISNAGHLLRAFDVVVLSSRTDGTPIVLFEAMAAGVPLVASAVGGIPDVVADSEAALVPPEHPAALAAAIARTLSDPAEAASLAGRAHRVLAERFAPGPWLDAYESLYRRVMRARR